MLRRCVLGPGAGRIRGNPAVFALPRRFDPELVFSLYGRTVVGTGQQQNLVRVNLRRQVDVGDIVYGGQIF